MCGVTGVLLPPSASLDVEALARKMADRIRHRGPDDCGVWTDHESNLGLGHRRLSIVDLSAAGHQPMTSESGRYVIVFNGEIYNYTELRDELDARSGAKVAWRGHSDTEVMLAAVEAWGLRAAVMRFVGMFSIAIWDRYDRILSLVRDRMGEKPLYYGWWNNGFVFASELKAMQELPGFSPTLDRRAISLFMCHGNIPAPWTVYEDFFKLLPGHILTLSAERAHDRTAASIAPYWSLVDTLKGNRFRGSPDDALDELDLLLSDAVRSQMVADVPVGAFLSGGIDSSLVVALMQEQSTRPVSTFSVGFGEAEFNEAPHAAAVAAHLGTEHTELTVTADDALAIVPDICRMWDEPFADSSQIPTALLSELTRKHVTVSLSGDGGDELFGGYPRYTEALLLERLPQKALLERLLRVFPANLTGAVRAIPHPLARRVTPKRLKLLAEVLAASNKLDRSNRYMEYFTQARVTRQLVLSDPRTPYPLLDFELPAWTEDLTAFCAIDAVTYLPDDILVKVDRAAMAVSLETRIPLLDHRVVEFAFSLPDALKIRGGQAKWPLRQLLYRRVPRALVDRPKMGFGIPLAEWLRGPLKAWANDLLSPESVAREGLLDPTRIADLWHQHLSGESDWSYVLWRVLILRSWIDANG
jgi:asparagine synthase (glutamine-hydrolysing)